MIFTKYYCNTGNLLDPCYYAGDEPCPVHGEGRIDMSERRFVIREWKSGHNPGWTISKDELIRRLNIICDEMHSPSRSIDILLNGEGEKVPEGCIVNPVLSRVCERGTKSCGVYHQPSTTPTRTEWEEWIVRMPSFYRELNVVREWFLSMPCVPKE